MIRRIKRVLGNQRGDILGYAVVSPFLLWIMMFILLGAGFLHKQNEMNRIINAVHETALVRGQFTMDLKEELLNKLDAEGFSRSNGNLEIVVTPAEAYDDDDSTYVPREGELEIRTLYKRPHWFYYLFFGSMDESKFYIGTQMDGMSEEW